MKYYYNNQDISIIIPSDAKRILVPVSGGADSALLFYLLCRVISYNKLDVKVYPIHGFDCWRNIFDVARKIVQFTQEDFPEVDIQRLLTFDATKVLNTEGQVVLEKGWLDPGFNQILNTLDIQYKYMGMNLYPDESFHYSGPTKNLEITRNPSITKDQIEFNKPFTLVDKSFIYALYNQLGILDLWDITVSCSSYPDDIGLGKEGMGHIHEETINNPNWPEPCGLCWGCAERDWAVKTYNDRL